MGKVKLFFLLLLIAIVQYILAEDLSGYYPTNNLMNFYGDDIYSDCQYYSIDNGWFMRNLATGQLVPCVDLMDHPVEKTITDYFGLHLDKDFSVVIQPGALKNYINSMGEIKPEDQNRGWWETAIFRNFQYIKIDADKNGVKFKCEAYKSKKSRRPISKKTTRDYWVLAEITAFLVPKIEDGKLFFDIELDNSEIIDYGGWEIVGGAITADAVIGPLLHAFMPSMGSIITTILNVATFPSIMDVIIDKIDDYAMENIPLEAKEVKEFQEIWKKVQQYDKYGFLSPSANMESNGLYLNFDYDITKFDDIYEDIMVPWNNLTGENTIITYLDKIQDIAIENLGRILTDDELAEVEKILGYGVGYVESKIKESYAAYEYKFMKGFDLSKFNSSKNMLIVSLAGAGPFNKVVLNGNENLIGLETLEGGDVPQSMNVYEDQIYQLASYYTDDKTVAVIGYPWLSTEESLQIDAGAYLPNVNRLSLKIKEALDKMAPDSKLLLIGKSLGGAKLEEIVNELNTLNVHVDLLVMVDPSATPINQSGSSYTRAIPTNVKKVYNYRQISEFPESNGQNGFPISFIAPTKGEDIIVGDVKNDIGVLPCEGVGHDDIDECEWLLNEIDGLIAKEKGFFDNCPIINSLLLD